MDPDRSVRRRRLRATRNSPKPDEVRLKERELLQGWVRIALQATAGLVVAFGAFSAWQQLTDTRTAQVTDRFSRAVELLGNQDAVDVRIGGIYALERLAEDSARDRDTVARVLAAFVVRTSQSIPPAPVTYLPDGGSIPTGIARASESPSATPSIVASELPRNARALRPVPPDPRAALNAISGLYRDSQRTAFDLSEADLSGMDIYSPAWPYAILVRADLSDTFFFEANLHDAILAGADLSGTLLKEGDLSDVNLSDANLSRATLIDVNFTDADMSGVNLKGACATPGTKWPDGFDADAAGVTIETCLPL